MENKIKKMIDCIRNKWSSYRLVRDIRNFQGRRQENLDSFVRSTSLESWSEFEEKVRSVYDKILDAPGTPTFFIESVDIKKEYQKILDGNSYCKKISSDTCPTIVISSSRGAMPVKGLVHIEYDKDAQGEGGIRVYKETPARLIFSRSPKGGIFVVLAYPVVKGLIEPNTDTFLYKQIARVGDANTRCIERAFRDFLLIAQEKTYYGRSTFLGRIRIKYIEKKGTVGAVLLNKLEKALLAVLGA